MRSKWKRAPKGWSRGKLAECAYVAITLAALNVHFAAKGNGRTDSPVQIWHRQREKGRGERVTSTHKRVQISSGRVPPSASSDAWCDVTDPIYAHWNNPIPSIPPPPPPPRRSRGPRRDLVETRPRLFISIYFDHRSPHLYPSASSRLVTKQRISQYILSPLKIILYRHRASFSIVIYGD